MRVFGTPRPPAGPSTEEPKEAPLEVTLTAEEPDGDEEQTQADDEPDPVGEGA